MQSVAALRALIVVIDSLSPGLSGTQQQNLQTTSTLSKLFQVRILFDFPHSYLVCIDEFVFAIFGVLGRVSFFCAQRKAHYLTLLSYTLCIKAHARASKAQKRFSSLVHLTQCSIPFQHVCQLTLLNAHTTNEKEKERDLDKERTR